MFWPKILNPDTNIPWRNAISPGKSLSNENLLCPILKQKHCQNGVELSSIKRGSAQGRGKKISARL